MKKNHAVLLHSAAALTFLGMAHTAAACKGSLSVSEVIIPYSPEPALCYGQMAVNVKGTDKDGNIVNYDLYANGFNGIAACQALEYGVEKTDAQTAAAQLESQGDCVDFDPEPNPNGGSDSCSLQCPPPPPPIRKCSCQPTGQPAVPINQLDGRCIVKYVLPPIGGPDWALPGSHVCTVTYPPGTPYGMSGSGTIF